ncbi:hypothetical protein [Candidatus Magnetominusculus xianensis]|uniref:Lipoprotein n=1 Tax=Candidatus Magnetominusculus xianensis TaxID=1748249 RepID=A0ABR5SGC0_9BACT|nr:hypothetical protein [Candidatus Magnetominusculus xianensis]KWT88542.1 hypothetical protein ASN18_1244 [Candidatus Magnetominusculus xianensis]
MKINIKNLLISLIRKLIYFVIFILILIKACEDDIIEDYYIWSGWRTLYFNEPGQSDQVLLNAHYDGTDLIKLDNFTKDAYDIKVFTKARTKYWLGVYYWLSFRYETFSTYCTEVDESKTAFPYSLMSPSWWPDELQKPFFEPLREPNRSNYKFYRCRAFNVAYRDSVFEYFAIDNKTKKGYYWKTVRKDKDMDNVTIKRYY